MRIQLSLLLTIFKTIYNCTYIFQIYLKQFLIYTLMNSILTRVLSIKILYIRFMKYRFSTINRTIDRNCSYNSLLKTFVSFMCTRHISKSSIHIEYFISSRKLFFSFLHRTWHKQHRHTIRVHYQI